MRKKVSYILLIIFAIFLDKYAISQVPFTVYGKLFVRKGDMTGVNIIVEDNGNVIQNFTPGKNGKFEFDFEYNKDYILSFTKPNYVTKKVEINTRIPDDVEVTYGWDPYEMGVEIFEKQENVDVYVFNQPVGVIKYNYKHDEFEYDTDYSKTVQKKIDKAEKELTQIADKKEENKNVSSNKSDEEIEKERAAKIAQLAAETAEIRKKEEEKKRKEEEKKAALLAQLKAEAEAEKLAEVERKRQELAEFERIRKLNEEMARKKSEEEALRKAEAEAKRQAQLKAEAEAARLAEEQRKKEEEQKKAELLAKIEAETEAARLAEEQKRAEDERLRQEKLAKINAEAEAARLAEEKKAKREAEKKAELIAKLKAEAEAAKHAEAEKIKKEEAERNAKINKLKAEAEAARLAKEQKQKQKEIEMQRILEEEQKRAEASALALKYPKEKNVEIVEENNKVITRVIVNKDGKIRIYLKVEHNWGAVFYFLVEDKKEPRNISEAIFIAATDI